jgi:predicted phosphoadenosine phosphosulfate sulfurtransferase
MEWYQIPFRLSNSTNHSDPFLHVWDEDLTHTLDPATGLPIPGSSGWVRDKEPDSIWVNDFVDSRGVKAERFRPVLHAINLRHGGASLVGLRMEESPARRMTVTSSPRYKWVTWCAMPKVRPEEDPFWMFYPIYDWTYRDIWKAIHENGWEYNAHYDHLFQYGTPVTKMRVSNYHHETALTSLHFLQEIEPETWDRTTRRLQGVNVYSKQTLEEMRVTSLPYMFASWDEYVRYLISTLVPDPAHQARFTHLYEVGLGQVKYTQSEQVARIMVHTVLGNDLDGTTLDNALVSIAGGEKYEQLRTARNDALAAGTELPQTNTTRRKATFITRDNAKETMRS